MQYDENAEKYGYEGEMTPMKCDELKIYRTHTDNLGDNYIDAEFVDVVLKEDVDAAIAELKEAWRSEHEACEALKEKLENVQASAYAESVDAGMRERRLRRALYKACANWAHAEYMWASLIDFKYPETWDEMERKCRVKMEEYK